MKTPIQADALAIAGLDHRLRHVLIGRYLFSSVEVAQGRPYDWVLWQDHEVTTLVIDGEKVPPTRLVEVELRHWDLLLAATVVEIEDEKVRAEKEADNTRTRLGRLRYVLYRLIDSQPERARSLLDLLWAP